MRSTVQDAFFDFPIFNLFMRLTAIGRKKMHKHHGLHAAGIIITATTAGKASRRKSFSTGSVSKKLFSFSINSKYEGYYFT